MSPGAGRVRVAVLGGGAGSLAAAFELTRTEALRRRFEVTIYQPGWRLGGKGASGRNAERSQRIEEHGLHVWFGFYRNALRLMEDCYRELAAADPSTPFRKLDDAFQPCEELVLCERSNGSWRSVCLPMPDAPPPSEQRFFSAFPRYLTRWLLRAWRSLDLRRPDESDEPPDSLIEADREAARQESLPDPDPRLYESVADRLGELSAQVEGPAPAGFFAALAAFWWAVVRVLGREVVPAYLDGDPAPFDHLNETELRDLLGSAVGFESGAEAFGQASFVRVLYDLAFGYREGDPDAPDLAGGIALENLLGILARHRGTMMLKMKGGMGDVIFAPLYGVLLERGVRFEFFTPARGFESARGSVERISLVRQARLRAPRYEPLVSAGGMPCWPHEPLLDQLHPDSRRLAKRLDRQIAFERELDPLGLRDHFDLRRGRDFDLAVCGIPVGALRELGGGLASGSEPFRRMLEGAGTVMTQAIQLWLSRPRAELGWPCGSGQALRDRDAILGAFAKPFDTWCDMTHLVEREHWRPPARPAQIAYLCGVLGRGPVGETWREADERARGGAVEFLERHWSHSGPAGAPFWERLDPADLLDPGGRPGWERFAAQYWRANAAVADRYATSHAGSIKHRLRPGESGFDNLLLAGDWTYTAVNAGSVEAAVMSGIEAARVAIRRAGADGPLPRLELPPWRREP